MLNIDLKGVSTDHADEDVGQCCSNNIQPSAGFALPWVQFQPGCIAYDSAWIAFRQMESSAGASLHCSRFHLDHMSLLSQGCAARDRDVRDMRRFLELGLGILTSLRGHPNIVAPLARVVTRRAQGPPEPVGLVMHFLHGGTLQDASRCLPRRGRQLHSRPCPA